MGLAARLEAFFEGLRNGILEIEWPVTPRQCSAARVEWTTDGWKTVDTEPMIVSGGAPRLFARLPVRDAERVGYRIVGSDPLSGRAIHRYLSGDNYEFLCARPFSASRAVDPSAYLTERLDRGEAIAWAAERPGGPVLLLGNLLGPSAVTDYRTRIHGSPAGAPEGAAGGGSGPEEAPEILQDATNVRFYFPGLESNHPAGWLDVDPASASDTDAAPRATAIPLPPGPEFLRRVTDPAMRAHVLLPVRTVARTRSPLGDVLAWFDRTYAWSAILATPLRMPSGHAPRSPLELARLLAPLHVDALVVGDRAFERAAS